MATADAEVAVEDTLAIGTTENTVGNTEIVGMVVQPVEPKPTAIKMMLHFKTSKDAVPRGCDPST